MRPCSWPPYQKKQSDKELVVACENPIFTWSGATFTDSCRDATNDALDVNQTAYDAMPVVLCGEAMPVAASIALTRDSVNEAN